MSSGRQTFTPSQLRNTKPVENLTVVSRAYFRVANELAEKSRGDNGGSPGHFYVFPAVSMYWAAFEAYLYEQLALSRSTVKRPPLIERLDALRDRADPWRDFKPWVREVFRTYDRNGNGFDTSSSEYQNMIALRALRNTILHYNPTFIEHTAWPLPLQEAVRRSKLEVFNGNWVTNLSSPRIAEWAHDVVRGSLQLFANISGAEDVFTCGEPIQWE